MRTTLPYIREVRGETKGDTQVTNTHENRGWGGAPATLLLRRATDAMDTALAYIADTPMAAEARDEMMRETAALLVRLEKLQSLLSRDGYLKALPVTHQAGI